MSTVEMGVDQLIQRVKSEAIHHAHARSAAIIEQAHEAARTIIAEAQAQAEGLLNEARSLAQREQRILTEHLELAARDFAIKLADRLKSQLFFPILKEQVRVSLKEPDFLSRVLERLIVEYVKDSPGNLDILVSKELKTTLAAFFAGAIFDQLDQNSDIRLKDEEGLEGFVLLRRDEHFVWDFRAETIAQELMRLLEPNLAKYFVPTKKSMPAPVAERAQA